VQKLSLQDWLEKIKFSHKLDMDLSLERVAEVARRLHIKPPCPVITVGGTNGKGSVVAGLESIYLAAGYRVGTFNSPILFKHNEYVRLQGQNAADELFCQAFEKIEALRGDITLTPFEYNALAAFIMFTEADLDVWVLEVGLGGRFDAVNVLDADVAIVTSIGIDHIEWLGDTREKIAFEKAGIFRPGQPAICGDIDPPKTLIDYARDLNTPLYIQNKQFGFAKSDKSWNWHNETQRLTQLPLTKLALQNMSTVLMAIDLMQTQLPVSYEHIVQGLETVTLPGRIQVVPGDITQIFDVSHNPHAAEFLANWLQQNKVKNKTRAVFSMLADKDIVGTLTVMKEWIDEWHIAPLQCPRAASLDQLTKAFNSAGIETVQNYSDIQTAHNAALQTSQQNELIVIFGSFHTVAEVITHNESTCELP
jgi:dihydrofolate synthase/folylpolyglutamate synthase